MANFCMNCGSRLAPGTRFCTVCGQQAPEYAAPPAMQQPKPSVPPQPVRPPYPSAQQPAQSNQPAQQPVRQTYPSVQQPSRPQSAPSSQGQRPRGTAPPRPSAPAPTAPPQPSSPAPGSVLPRPSAPAPEKPRRSGGAVVLTVFLSVIMAVELILTAYWRPGFLRKDRDGSDWKRETAASERGSAASDRETASGSSKTGKDGDTELPEWPYHSKALDFSPTDGIQVTAEEGALYDDTELSITPIGDDQYERMAAVSEQMIQEGIYMLGAWEVDAGLEEDENLPRGYHVSMDLKALGIPESLYPALQVQRLTDSGLLQTYHSEVNGSVLSYDARQNSVIILSAILVAVSVGSVLKKVYEPDLYFVYHVLEGTGSKLVKHDDVTYTVKWRMKDIDPEQQKRLERIAAIEEKHKKKAEEEYDAEEKVNKASMFGMFRGNQSVAERLAEKLKEDQEYQKLQESLAVPPFVQEVIKLINIAYDYLKNVEFIDRPDYDLYYYLVPQLGDLGQLEDNWARRPWININADAAAEILSGSEKGKTERDNMLLTITHELFHACQNMYHSRLMGDSSRFDEMVTLVLEYDAKEWYKSEGIITTDPKLTPSEVWNCLTLPMDEDHDALDKQGYMLSNLVLYIRERTGQYYISAVHMMHARSYYKTPTTSEPLMKAFKLTEAQFAEYFMDWCISIKAQISNDYIDETVSGTKKLPVVPLGETEGAHVSLKTLGSYTCAARCFKTKKRDYVPLLLVMDSGAAAAHPECTVCPAEEYRETGSGFYIPLTPETSRSVMQKDIWQLLNDYGYRFILEIYVKGGKADDLGYTVYRMGEPEAPGLSLDGQKLNVKLPKPAGAAKAGALDGLRITIEASDGTKTEKDIEKGDFGKTVSFDVNKLKNKNTDGIPGLKVTITEFVKDKKGNLCFGLPSKEAELKGAEPEWVDPFEYFGAETSGQVFEALKTANVSAIRVTPMGFYGTSYETKKDKVFPIDNTESFVIDMTDGAVTEWSTTLTAYEKKVTYSVTFKASKDSMYRLTAVTTYTGSKEGKTPAGAMMVMNQIGDIPEIKRAFSVNRNNTRRMLFTIEEVLLQ